MSLYSVYKGWSGLEQDAPENLAGQTSASESIPWNLQFRQVRGAFECGALVVTLLGALNGRPGGLLFEAEVLLLGFMLVPQINISLELGRLF